MKDAEAVDRVSEIIAGRRDEAPIVVVSAMGGTTDDLEEILETLGRGEVKEARSIAGDLGERHREIASKILPEGPLRSEALGVLEEHEETLDRYIEGISCLGEVSPRSRDAVLSLGELISSALMTRFLRSRSVEAAWVDPRGAVVTDGEHTIASPRLEETRRACREAFAPILSEGIVPVTGGFVGASDENATTTLGRGGSDLSASLIAAAVGADRIEFWKDVDGILTADPRIVPGARPVSSLTFRETAEIAFLGARVLHPSSIQPAVRERIPVRVLNSYRPDAPGTEIRATGPSCGKIAGPRGAVAAIAYKRGQILLNVHSNRMLGASGFLKTVFEVFDRLRIPVDHIATSEVNVTVTMAPSRSLDRLREDLGTIARVEVIDNAGIVSVVGENLARTPGVASRVFAALDTLNVTLITYGGSGVNLSLALADPDVPRAVSRLHEELIGPADALETEVEG